MSLDGVPVLSYNAVKIFSWFASHCKV